MHRLPLLCLLLVAACTPGSARAPDAPPSVIVTGSGAHVQLSGGARDQAARLDAAPGTVWPAVLRVYEELGLPVSSVNTSQWQVGSRKTFSRRLGGERLSRYVDCGAGSVGAPNADSYLVTLSVDTRLEEASTAAAPGTVLHSSISGTGKDPGSSKDQIRCTSTARLEARIAEMVSEEVAG